MNDLTHREQRGAVVTKAWRGVRRIEAPTSDRTESTAESARGYMPRGGFTRTGDDRRGVKAENIAHRSDLASLCVSNATHDGRRIRRTVDGIVGFQEGKT